MRSAPLKRSVFARTDEGLADEERRAARVTVNFSGVRLRQVGGWSTTTELCDLSSTGFCVQWPADLRAGQRIWLTLPELRPLMATVIWNSGSKMGCKFEVPLHSAVLYRLTTAHLRSS